MYKHFDKNENDNISLHDCRATNASLENGILSFVFADGFWICEDNIHNTYGKILCTDEAKMEIHLLYADEETNITIYEFIKENNRTIREEYSVKELIEKINRPLVELEFLYSYKGYQSVIFECCLWFDEPPYSRECVLIVSTDDITFCWNNICEDKIW